METRTGPARPLRCFCADEHRRTAMNTTPIEAADVLNGYDEIATFLRITVRQAKHRAAIGAIPVFKVGRSVSARKSSILSTIAKAERDTQKFN